MTFARSHLPPLAFAIGLVACDGPAAGPREVEPSAAAGKADDPGAPAWCAPTEAEVLGDIDDPAAVELSGLVISRGNPGVLWVHNDGGSGPRETLLAVDARGRTLAHVSLRGASNRDWEDIALVDDAEGGVLYLGDVGDNDASRRHVEIVRVREPRIDPADDFAEIELDDAVTFELVYEDGEAHDAEAIFVDPVDQVLYVLSKALGDERGARLYAAELPLADQGTLWQVADERDLPALDEPVVAADISADGSRITVLLDSGRHLLFARGAAQSVADALAGSSCEGEVTTRDTEAIAFSADGRARIFVPEGSHPDLLAVADADGCGAWLPPLVTGHAKAKHTSELSGAVLSRRNAGVVWTHGDGDDGEPLLLALDDQGDVMAKLRATSAENVDWEDLARLPGARPRDDALVVGDIGDADRVRDHLTLYRIREPDLDDLEPGTTEVSAEAFDLHWADGRPRHAKALLVDPATGDVVVIAGGHGEPTTVFVAPAPWTRAGSTALHAVLDAREQPALAGRVVAADVTPGGEAIVLLFEDHRAERWTTGPDRRILEALRGPSCTIPTPRGDYEALAIDPSGNALVLVQEHEQPALWRIDRVGG